VSFGEQQFFSRMSPKGLFGSVPDLVVPMIFFYSFFGSAGVLFFVFVAHGSCLSASLTDVFPSPVFAGRGCVPTPSYFFFFQHRRR